MGRTVRYLCYNPAQPDPQITLLHTLTIKASFLLRFLRLLFFQTAVVLVFSTFRVNYPAKSSHVNFARLSQQCFSKEARS